MGCNASKSASGVEQPTRSGGAGASGDRKLPSGQAEKRAGGTDDATEISNTISASKPERLYKLLAKAFSITGEDEVAVDERNSWYHKALLHCQQEPMAAKWKNPTTQSTPLHLTARLMDVDATNPVLLEVLDILLEIDQGGLRELDVSGNSPLHYAVAPTTHFNNTNSTDTSPSPQSPSLSSPNKKNALKHWKSRAIFIQHMIQTDLEAARDYLSQNSVSFESGDATGGCSPLYRVLQTLPDDFDPTSPTAEYVASVMMASTAGASSATASGAPHIVSMGNASDADKPLNLLYRRFTRQFDISEKFFAGDNSRPEVVQHRQAYKIAAGNTWKIMEVLLKDSAQTNAEPAHPTAMNHTWGIVHRAVQVETPPDLLRYIVETNAQDLTRVDAMGNLPLHYAASSKPPSPPPTAKDGSATQNVHFPSFYSKYVMDELLYKFPEAASMTDGTGNFPLTLAIQSGKQWIGGGIKSLYDAYPNALQQINLKDHPTLLQALSMDENGELNLGKETKEEDVNVDEKILAGVVKDEQHDAIMLVQQPDVDIAEIVTSMWAHEEDAGVQMLGCVAISNKLQPQPGPRATMQIALSAVAAVVNAMKAHPNEMIVQEKACQALQLLAPSDGQREVSMVASGAVAAIVGAMQAHVGDAGVQEQACAAVAAIVQQGGADRATVVASVSGVTAILNALAAHADAQNVQMAGLEALAALTQVSKEANLPDLTSSQTEPLLLSAREKFPDTCGPLAASILTQMGSVNASTAAGRDEGESA